MNTFTLILVSFLIGILVGRLPRRRPKRKSVKFNKSALYKKQNGICLGCENHYLKKDMTIDHIRPFSLKGSDQIDNLQLLCHNCNSLKGNRPMSYLMERLKKRKP